MSMLIYRLRMLTRPTDALKNDKTRQGSLIELYMVIDPYNISV